MRQRWCGALILVLASCSVGRRETPSSVAAGGLASRASSGPSAADAGAPRSSPRERDPRWQHARDEDPAERARLAVDVGAAGLLEGLDDGGEIADVALSALPYADDAESALGKLAAIAVSEQALRRKALEAILLIAGRPRSSRELVDPEGARRAAEAILGLAARKDIEREDRALAVSIARAFAEKGYVDPKRIPTDLDPT